MVKKNYWVSWYHVREFGEFELHFPWWVTGTRVYDGAETVCAAVQADSEADARLMVEAAYDRHPYDVEWRFVTEKPLGWSPYSDRFQQAEWMPDWPVGESRESGSGWCGKPVLDSTCGLVPGHPGLCGRWNPDGGFSYPDAGWPSDSDSDFPNP